MVIARDILIVGSVTDSKPILDYFKTLKDLKYRICDIFEKKSDMTGLPTFDIDSIGNIEYYCVVITVKPSLTVKKILVEEYNVDSNKILEFWKIYNAHIPLMVCDRIMLNPRNASFDGIICGLSYTEVGILPEKLNGTFANLSVSSQDIYYQYKTIKYCYEKYTNKMKDMKYAIIEVHDYNYFNFDTSLGRASYEYLAWGGYNQDKHNFDKNEKYDFTFEQAMQYIINQKYADISESELLLWDTVCRDVFAYNDFDGFNGNFDITKRTTIVSDEHIKNFLYNRAVATKIFPKTIKENTLMLGKLFELLLEINPKIKIYTIIIPSYIELQKRDHEMQKHIPIFNKIMTKLGQNYNFTHLDFNKISDISNHRNFYYDAGHLNIFGASKLTKMLNNIIFGDYKELSLETEY